MSKLVLAEYIWLDGVAPTAGLRSKARVVEVADELSLETFPEWSFDGSSTEQAAGEDSDCILRPVRFVADPIRRDGSQIVLCEVLNADHTIHSSNTRAKLRAALSAGGDKENPWLGFEQEYTLFKDGRPLGWPEEGEPAAQGPYYCGNGGSKVFGRDLVEEHAKACMQAGLMFYGINAEVMPGQWEFQIGYRGVKGEVGDALTVTDDMQIARYLLDRLSENHGITVSLDNKPIKGDWNGAGMHTNFSTDATRNPNGGMQAIHAAVEALAANHDAHVRNYGHKLDERLTGDHETCDINTFKSGVANRGASIRIPRPVEINGYGYLEDRRPGANSCPYMVAACLIASICGDEGLLELVA